MSKVRHFKLSSYVFVLLINNNFSGLNTAVAIVCLYFFLVRFEDDLYGEINGSALI
jgi:hypothetical protein